MRELSVHRWMLLGVATMLGAAALLAMANVRSQPRELTLVARNMTFYRPGDPTPNPTLRFRPREAVLITLVNEDRGMPHDFVVKDTRFEIPSPDPRSNTRSALFRAPAEPGRFVYVCTLHPILMQGMLEVVEEP